MEVVGIIEGIGEVDFISEKVTLMDEKTMHLQMKAYIVILVAKVFLVPCKNLLVGTDVVRHNKGIMENSILVGVIIAV